MYACIVVEVLILALFSLFVIIRRNGKMDTSFDHPTSLQGQNDMKLGEEKETAEIKVEPPSKELESLHHENQKLIAAVDEANCREAEATAQVQSLRNALDESKAVEQELQTQLREVQGMCDELVSRLQKIQEEKSELIMASHERVHNVEPLEELRAEIGALKGENQALLGRLESAEAELKRVDNERLTEIDNLTNKLRLVRSSEAQTRKCLDDTQAAGEELIKRVQTIQEEKFNLLDKCKEVESDLRRSLEEKDSGLLRITGAMEKTKSELEAAQNRLAEHEKQLSFVEENLRQKSEELSTTKLELAQLQKQCQNLETENSELKLKLDEFENEKGLSTTENHEEIVVLRAALADLQVQLKQSAVVISEKER